MKLKVQIIHQVVALHRQVLTKIICVKLLQCIPLNQQMTGFFLYKTILLLLVVIFYFNRELAFKKFANIAIEN
jgi:hypothetical protein